MKKILFKWIAQLFAKLSKLSKWDILGFESVARHLYQIIRQQEFVIQSHDIINVKKGKIKYSLLIIETSEGRVRFNLGRHQEENESAWDLPSRITEKRKLHDQYVTN